MQVMSPFASIVMCDAWHVLVAMHSWTGGSWAGCHVHWGSDAEGTWCCPRGQSGCSQCHSSHSAESGPGGCSFWHFLARCWGRHWHQIWHLDASSDATSLTWQAWDSITGGFGLLSIQTCIVVCPLDILHAGHGLLSDSCRLTCVKIKRAFNRSSSKQAAIVKHALGQDGILHGIRSLVRWVNKLIQLQRHVLAHNEWIWLLSGACETSGAALVLQVLEFVSPSAWEVLSSFYRPCWERGGLRVPIWSAHWGWFNWSWTLDKASL